MVLCLAGFQRLHLFHCLRHFMWCNYATACLRCSAPAAAAADSATSHGHNQFLVTFIAVSLYNKPQSWPLIVNAVMIIQQWLCSIGSVIWRSSLAHQQGWLKCTVNAPCILLLKYKVRWWCVIHTCNTIYYIIGVTKHREFKSCILVCVGPSLYQNACKLPLCASAWQVHAGGRLVQQNSIFP